MTPKVQQLLEEWNGRRLELEKVQDEILNLQTRLDHLNECMNVIPVQLEDLLNYELEQPLGIKIDDDYIVVVQDSHLSNFVIQNVDFNLRQEITDE